MQATRLPLQKSDPWSTEVSSSDSADGSGMDEFGYLAVILSIILGLSVTQLLQGLSNVIGSEATRVPLRPALFAPSLPQPSARFQQ